MDSLNLLPNSGTASNDPRDIDKRVKAEENVVLKFAHKSWLQVDTPWYSTSFGYFSNCQSYVIMAMATKNVLLVFLSFMKPHSLPSFTHPCFCPLMPYNPRSSLLRSFISPMKLQDCEALG